MTSFKIVRHGEGLGSAQQTRMRFISGTDARRLVGSAKVSCSYKVRGFLLIQSYWLEMRGSAVLSLRNLPDNVIAETSKLSDHRRPRGR